MRNHSLPRRQRGVALIVTLFILVIVTFVGLIAMRSGMQQVAMSTNSQVAVVLFQNADAGTSSVESVINASAEFANGPKGPITLIKDNPGQAVVGCFTKTGLKLADTVASPRKCDLSQTGDFVSGRGVVVVQVAVQTPVDSSGKAQTIRATGSDEAVLPGGNGALVAVYATSVMPNYGSATKSQIDTCLGKPQEATGTTQTVTSCLVSSNASFQTVVQEFVYGYGGYK